MYNGGEKKTQKRTINQCRGNNAQTDGEESKKKSGGGIVKGIKNMQETLCGGGTEGRSYSTRPTDIIAGAQRQDSVYMCMCVMIIGQGQH